MKALCLIFVFSLYTICSCYTNFTGIELCARYFDYPSSYGSYGEMGVPSPTNFPGARSWIASTYNKKENIMYIFGGYGFGESSGGMKWKSC